MNNGVKYGNRFRDPPSLQKQIFILRSSLGRIVERYKDDPEYDDYKEIIDKIKIFYRDLDDTIMYMNKIDAIKREEYLNSLPKKKELTPEELMEKRMKKYQDLVEKDNLEIAEEFTTWNIED